MNKPLIDKECTFVSGSTTSDLHYNRSWFSSSSVYTVIPIYEDTLPHPFPPHHILPHPLVEGVVGVCHPFDVGTLQAMLTEHLELDITLTTEGGVIPSSEQVGGVTHTSFFDN